MRYLEKIILLQKLYGKQYTPGKNSAKYFSDSHEYILCYCKNKDYL